MKLTLIIVALILCVRPALFAGKQTTQLRLKTTVPQEKKLFHWVAWPHIQVNATLENQYMERFGNDTDPCDMRDGLEEWPEIKACDFEYGIETLKKWCARLHEKAGRGKNVTVTSVLLRPRRLTFRNYNFEDRRVYVLSYGVQGEVDLVKEPLYWYLHEGPHGYITKGRRPDCVYFLRLLSALQKKYVLYEEVCGIEPVKC